MTAAAGQSQAGRCPGYCQDGLPFGVTWKITFKGPSSYARLGVFDLTPGNRRQRLRGLTSGNRGFHGRVGQK